MNKSESPTLRELRVRSRKPRRQEKPEKQANG